MKETTIKIIDRLFKRFPEISDYEDEIRNTVKMIVKCYKNKGKLLICGNGGSASDSLHIVGELMKSFVLPRKLEKKYIEKIQNLFPKNADYFIENLQGTLPAISLVNETALMTAYSNDNSADLCFAQQVLGYGNSNDILIAISTSGNSQNVIYASQIAKVKDMKVISLTGRNGGKLKKLSDININVSSAQTFIIQEYHLPIYHTLCLAVENEIFGDDN